jgi:hypothetical protein
MAVSFHAQFQESRTVVRGTSASKRASHSASCAAFAASSVWGVSTAPDISDAPDALVFGAVMLSRVVVIVISGISLGVSSAGRFAVVSVVIGSTFLLMDMANHTTMLMLSAYTDDSASK